MFVVDVVNSSNGTRRAIFRTHCNPTPLFDAPVFFWRWALSKYLLVQPAPRRLIDNILQAKVDGLHPGRSCRNTVIRISDSYRCIKNILRLSRQYIPLPIGRLQYPLTSPIDKPRGTHCASHTRSHLLVVNVLCARLRQVHGYSKLRYDDYGVLTSKSMAPRRFFTT